MAELVTTAQIARELGITRRAALHYMGRPVVPGRPHHPALYDRAHVRPRRRKREATPPATPLAVLVSEWLDQWDFGWVAKHMWAGSERGWRHVVRRFWQRDVPHERAFGRRYPTLGYDPCALLVRLTPDVESWLAAQGL